MSSTSPFSSVLVGSDSLLVECGEILLEAGHSISRVVTDQPRIADWARERGIETRDPAGDVTAALAGAECDVLFTITWLSILPAEALAVPRRAAINFHDGPLPAYAGIHAPAWALLAGERSYGVTWHALTEGIDRGDVLEQERFELAPDETSLTLNTRCFEAGLASFRRLVDALGRDALAPRPQDTATRSYFAKFRRPAGACELDWRRSATDLEALVRALDFGPYANPLGTARLSHGGVPYSVASCAVRAGSGEPGTVLSVDADALVVACGTGALALTGFRFACGAALAPDALARRTGLRAGDRLDTFDDDRRDRLTRLHEELARHEGSWTRRLAALEPVELLADADADAPRREHAVALPTLFDVRFPGEAFAPACVAALGGYLARTADQELLHVGFRSEAAARELGDLAPWTAPVVPLEVRVDFDASFADLRTSTDEELARVAVQRTWMRDLIGREPALRGRADLASGALLPVEIVVTERADAFDTTHAAPLSFLVDATTRSVRVSGSGDLEALCARLATWFASVAADERPLGRLSLLPDAERARVLEEWNATEVEFQNGACLHTLFERQVDATPDAPALTAEGETLTFAQLDARANRLARRLLDLGVTPGDRVGIHLERSLDLVVAVLAALKAGGAYVPLDPEFPAERVAYMLADSGAVVLVSRARIADLLPRGEAHVVCLDSEREELAALPDARPTSGATASDAAYVIYTSGSTGKPKGVVVEHRNVVNFFAGMDTRIERGDRDVWLAVTSLSFDISVLELLWTACRGFETVLYAGLRRSARPRRDALGFGLSFFASNRNEDPAVQYRFLLDAARFADTHGFASIWTPERHFHAFGGLYPNPSVTSAAIAAITENVRIRSASVVVGLHHPVRIAEEWSLVDNLSNGRVGISIASGWHPNDFVLAPGNFADRKELMIENTRIVRRLWRGEAVEFPGHDGAPVATRIMPRPVQPELPVWVTAAGNPDTFRQAGELGANLLTHLLGQSVDELAEKLAVYREAWKAAGHAGRGRVTIMLHTFVGEDDDAVRETVREPMRDYLRTAVDLIKNHVSSWSAVKRSVEGGAAPEIGSLEDLPAEDVEALLDYAFERYYEGSALFGTPERCMALIERLHALGIDEISCLVDFGVPCEQVLASLPVLDELRRTANERLGAPERPAESVAELVAARGVTHLQCTPSMAAVLLEDPATAEALAGLRELLIGGEPFPKELADRLTRATRGHVLNMYGPTETTIWSSVAEVRAGAERMTIGTPIANTQLYVLDARLEPVPVGAVGELWIGGAGVTRGYHERPELTAERFVPNPFRPGERMYRTGDRARWLESGEVEFLGRVDHQVKVRGYRIELGEIESALTDHDHVARAVVVARGEGPETRLVAFVVAGADAAPTARGLAKHLARRLPDYMVPEEFEFVSEFPLTPNKKVDRNALARGTARTAAPAPQPAETPVEARPAARHDDGGELDVEHAIETILAIWCDVLGLERCGADENFFDLGGHSLLTIRVQKALRATLGVDVPLVDMFRFTTVRSLAEHLAGDAGANTESAGPTRAEQRAARRRRRAS